MRGKFIAGAIVGAAVGMMMMPDLDRSTKRKIRRTAKFMKNVAEDAFDGMKGRMG
ncbi:YtxH domain-containing protein [Clostridium sp. CX1]|uniref:YtxH domain-containing protein n=1 Tax=Clostridium tanneri TaxID=3037988 RepID=A0ABU4JVR8_9CLOT|nr:MULTISPECIES: YtxH domain-containing protein [unclassified Clostridium]MCT8978344.1 YtxH domain-containing protein [Clostridium sp. CX1]MDW8802241.1 YtxH domain-containing protein [Clostridium sp. A1-XYC3]